MSGTSTESSSLPFGTRLWFAYVCFFRVLFDGMFAARAFRARLPELPAADPAPAKKVEPVALPALPSVEPALQLLALLQREGRFVDFLEEDVTALSDADIGAAARVVHDGCRKALRAHGKLRPVRSEDEGVKVTVAAGTSPAEVKLVGNVRGVAPFSGVLRHRGWRLDELSLPTAIAGHDVRVVAPAEVEL
ncbi:MAG: DUF2760 domain-containing protein [Polyangiales bacterium]